MDLTDIWIKYKKTIILVGANVAGLLVIIGIYYLIMGLASGPIPKPELATPKEIVEFVASPRFKIQSNSFKLDFGQKMVNYYSTNPARIEQLGREVQNLSPVDAGQLRENAFDMVKVQIVEDAMQYSRLTDSKSRNEFVQGRFHQGQAFRAMITGRGDAGGGVYGSGKDSAGGGGKRVNIAAAPNLAKGMPSDSAGMYKMMVQQTNPSDRAKMETYVQDMKSYVDKAKAQSK